MKLLKRQKNGLLVSIHKDGHVGLLRNGMGRWLDPETAIFLRDMLIEANLEQRHNKDRGVGV